MPTTNKEHKNRVYTLIGVALALFLGALDQTIVSTAMPRIVSDLSGLERYTWVTTIYLLISTLLVPIFGKLSDIRSRRGLELWSVTVFLIGSALCGLAGEFGTLPLLGDGMNQLIVFRGIQAFGGAGIFSLAFIIVSDLYPPRERGKINGMFGAVFGLSSVFGPLIGGFLTDNAGAWIPAIHGWRWVFYVNIPIGLVALWFIITKMPRLHAHDKSHKMDYLSAGLMLAAFFPLVLGLQLDKTTYPWTSPTILGLLGGSAALMAIWIFHSLKKSAHPIINLRLFLNPVFLTSSLAVFFFGAAFMAVIIFLPLYMVNVQGVSATQAGASIIPMSLGIVIGAQLSGTLVTKWGRYKGIAVVGSIIALIAGIFLATLGVGTPLVLAIGFMILVGIGFGPSQSIYALAVQNAVKPQEIGQATSTIQFSRQIGSAIGAAVLGVIFTTTLSTAFSANMPSSSATATVNQQSQLRSEGPKEIRASFDHIIGEIDPLFALRGEAAKAGLETFLNDPELASQVRDELKLQFKDGTPAMGVDAGYAALTSALQAAFMSGKPDAVTKVFEAFSATDAAGRAGPAANMPDFVKSMVARQAANPDLKARQATWANVAAQFDDSRMKVADEVSLAAAAAAKKGLGETRDKLVTGISTSFAQAIQATWLANVGVMVLLLLMTLLIPSLVLRGKGEQAPAEGAAPAPAAH